MDTSHTLHSPSFDALRPQRWPSLQSLGLLSLALLSAAIVVSRLSVALQQGVHGWDITYWLLAVVPPAYLVWLVSSAWLAQRGNRMPTRRVMLFVLMPLVPIAVYVLLTAIDSIVHPSRYAWGESSGWLVLDFVSWICVSMIAVGCFVHILWQMQADAAGCDEPNVRPETSTDLLGDD